MPAPRISYAEFELSFADTPDTEDDEACPGKDEQLEAMEQLVPKRARFLGNLTNEIAHSPGLTWVIDDHYYLLPWEKNGYTWALFRIAWDDNWGRYEFQAEARIRGVTDPMEAARQMFHGLTSKWGYDLEDPEYAPYKEFLEKLYE
jgi:hypothetical protein